MGLNLSRLFQPTNPDKPLGGRYKIISQLGAGGFGQTFLAEDLHLPGHPQCVVKQLKPQVSDAKSLQTARRLFDIEAEVLYQLGSHDQIPRLLAHFEDDREFYLVQELIEGEPVTQELAGGVPWSEGQVITFLQDLLQVLAFVHQQDVIHRDIKPSNLIRCRQDGRIVLIDFGAVKQVSRQVVNPKPGETKTISIGTQGYTPKEQLGGNPRFSSDVYAVGIIGIQALTGVHPRRLTEDPETGEIIWRDRVTRVSTELAAILDRMVCYDFRDRYPTAAQALLAVRSLPCAIAKSEPLSQELSEATTLLPSQELQPPATTTASTESAKELSSTPIWVPTEPSVQPQSSVEPTGYGTDATLIWVPTDPPVQLPPTARNTGSREPQTASVRSQVSGNSAPTIATAQSNQRQFVRPWVVLLVLGAVGTTVLSAKSHLFPQHSIQTADHIQTPDGTGMPAETPTARVAETPAPSSSTSSPIETPTASTSNTSALPSPASSPATTPTASATTKTSAPPSPVSSPAETPTASTTKTSAPPSPARLSASTKASSRPVQPATKPTPAPAPTQPADKSAPPRQEPQASELLSQADRLQQVGEYQKALELYDQAIATKPDIAQAYWGRCYSLNALQQPVEAIAACNKALDLNPNYPEALWSKGNALDQQQRHSDALTLYEQATALKPDFAEAWNNQGAALLVLGRASEAIAALDKATALKPDFADAWANRGAALWSLKRFRLALISINRALQIQPDNQNALNLRQQAQEKLGR